MIKLLDAIPSPPAFVTGFKSLISWNETPLWPILYLSILIFHFYLLQAAGHSSIYRGPSKLKSVPSFIGLGIFIGIFIYKPWNPHGDYNFLSSYLVFLFSCFLPIPWLVSVLVNESILKADWKKWNIIRSVRHFFRDIEPGSACRV